MSSTENFEFSYEYALGLQNNVLGKQGIQLWLQAFGDRLGDSIKKIRNCWSIEWPITAETRAQAYAAMVEINRLQDVLELVFKHHRDRNNDMLWELIEYFQCNMKEVDMAKQRYIELETWYTKVDENRRKISAKTRSETAS